MKDGALLSKHFDQRQGLRPDHADASGKRTVVDARVQDAAEHLDTLDPRPARDRTTLRHHDVELSLFGGT